MTTIRKTYSVGKIKKLVDLNGDSTNFDITFNVRSKDQKPFYLLVADQTTLDNSPDLEYKYAANGQMSGNMIQDKDIFQNYYLLLKADEPCECEVEIVKKDLPKGGISGLQTGSIPGGIPGGEMPSPEQYPALPEKESSWKTWLLIIIAIGAAIIIYYYLGQKNKNKEQEQKEVKPSPPKTPASVKYSPPAEPQNFSTTPSPASSGSLAPAGGTLMDRLKRLHMT